MVLLSEEAQEVNAMSATTTDRSIAEVSVNGETREFDGPTHMNALDFLRAQGLTAAKAGRAAGDCAACAIMITRPDPAAGTRSTSINYTLLPATAHDGQEVITAEGLADAEGVHPVQEEMAVRGGSQCGYCTPGFICSMAAEYYRPERAADAVAGAAGGSDHHCGP